MPAEDNLHAIIDTLQDDSVMKASEAQKRL